MFIRYIISSPATGRTQLYYLCEVLGGKRKENKDTLPQELDGCCDPRYYFSLHLPHKAFASESGIPCTLSKTLYYGDDALSTKPVMLIWTHRIPANRCSCSQQSLVSAGEQLHLHLVAGIRGAQIASYRQCIGVSPNARSLLVLPSGGC